MVLRRELACLIFALAGQFNKLIQKPDDSKLVNRICCNLLSYYVNKFVLHNPQNISELTTLCKRYYFGLTDINLFQKQNFRVFLFEVGVVEVRT